jgi:hypothetical protein
VLGRTLNGRRSTSTGSQRGKLLNVVPGSEFDNLDLIGWSGVREQDSEFIEVVFVTRRRHEEEHAYGRCSRVGKRMGTTGWNKHGASGATSHHLGAGFRLPGPPVLFRSNAWLEREEVELAFKNIEQFLGLTVKVGADIESWRDLCLENGPVL